MLPAELLKRIREIEIYTEHLANDVFAGQYLSTFKGQGMEFEEVREYTPGDDVRNIDWRVTARAGHPYVRKYVEERELTVMLVVDASGSMQFGSGDLTKAETMAETAAVLAFSAIRNHDKVGLLIFTDDVECYVPPRKGRRQVLRVIREVLYTSPERKATNLARALEYVNHVLTRRAIIFVISDFLAEDYQKPLRVAARRHDVVCLHIEDPREKALPSVGLFEIEEAETGRRMVVPLTRGLSAALAAGSTGRLTLLQKDLSLYRADLIPLQAGQSPVGPLLGFFEGRARRR